MSIVCPSCDASLNPTSSSGAIAFCLACKRTDSANQPKPKTSVSAVVALILGGVGISFLVAAFADKTSDFMAFLISIFFGGFAVAIGLNAIETIDRPHKRRKGRVVAWLAVVLGVVSFFAPIGLFAYATTVGMEHTLTNNSVSVRPKGTAQRRRSENTVLGKLPEASIAFDNSKAANGYQSLLPDEIQWRVYHPVGADPKNLDPDFHSTFMNSDFDDSEWMSVSDTGDGVGYGDNRYGYKLRKPVNAVDRRTAYLRTTFDTDMPLSKLVLQLRMDDGLMVYVDGELLWRANMPATAKEGYNTMATKSISGGDEETTIAIEMGQEIAVGSHVLAISVHNIPTNRNSSDLGVQRVALHGLPADAPPETIDWNVAAPSPLGRLPEASIEFDKSKDANGYLALLPDEINWRVHHPQGADPLDMDPDFHSTFMNAEFDDTQWEGVTDTGDGLGYGDDRYGYKLVRPENEADRKTAYFRTTFETDLPLSRVVIQMRMDDAAFVYVDGQRIWRANLLPESTEEYDGMAANSITGDDEEKTIAVEMLHEIPAGSHVLAISLHNCVNSSDLGMQRVMLYGLPSIAPEPAIQWNVAAHETGSGEPLTADGPATLDEPAVESATSPAE